MKVVNIISTNFFGGPEKQILTLSYMLGKKGIGVRTVTFADPGVQNKLQENFMSHNCDVKIIETSSAYSVKQFFKLKNELSADPPDFLLTHGYRANLLGLLLRRYLGCRVVFVSRGWTSENNKIRLFEFVDKILYWFADHIVCVSRGQERKIFKLGVPRERISTIHNCLTIGCGKGFLSSSLNREMLSLPEDCLIVASAGRLSPEKNFAMLVDVAKILCKEFSNICFVIFGEGRERLDLEESIKKAGLEDRFLLPGFFEGMNDLFAQIDIFALTSISEGLPNVILEAFSWAVPVVSTDVGGVSEIVQDGKNGFLVDPGDASSFASAIGLLIDNPEQRRFMGADGQAVVTTDFSAESQCEKYMSLLSRLS